MEKLVGPTWPKALDELVWPLNTPVPSPDALELPEEAFEPPLPAAGAVELDGAGELEVLFVGPNPALNVRTVLTILHIHLHSLGKEN